MLLGRGHRGCLGKELVKPAPGCGKSGAGLAVVAHRGVFPGQRCVPRTSESSASLPAPFPWELQLVLPARWGKVPGFALDGKRTSEFANELKGAFSYSSIQHIPPGTCSALW